MILIWLRFRTIRGLSVGNMNYRQTTCSAAFQIIVGPLERSGGAAVLPGAAVFPIWINLPYIEFLLIRCRYGHRIVT